MSTEAPQAAAAPQALREDIIESAVRFLADPKVQASTLAKKIAFLETKGLTNAEIEDALTRARNPPAPPAGSTTVAAAAAAPPGFGYAQQMQPPAPPPRPHLDWKDYFIAAVVAGGLGYGLFMLAKKYVMPLLEVREDNRRLEEERKVLVEQGEQTRKQLDALSESTMRILDSLAQQAQKSGDAVEGMAAAMDELAKHGTEQKTQATRLLLTLEDLQTSIAALAAKGARNDSAKIADVQSDIRSLRSLILSRRVPAPRPSTPSMNATPETHQSPEESPQMPAGDSDSHSATSMPTPTIPAWQLGGSADDAK
ncbi:peroxisomal membrane protein pex14 [Coemansia nantahalensis]|uniref:Peroxisomal membrane protein pex14 n=1 Tax=Coemansia nantahalensis TaxID=2789366 RepID=A0ACC1K5E9_9FUNG|nr:peroxisomal membrane protein pex14 [Coemansia nantahalensis]